LKVKAVFAKLGVVDRHEDFIFAPGFFDDGLEVVLSAYGHTSWVGVLPIGKGVLSYDGDDCIVDGEFFDTPSGVESFNTLKGLGGLCQWSFGFTPIDYTYLANGLFLLTKAEITEVSPVIKGACYTSKTIEIKGLGNVDPEPSSEV
jgi:hypothetical protein